MANRPEGERPETAAEEPWPPSDPWAFGEPVRTAVTYARSADRENAEPKIGRQLTSCHRMAQRLGAYVVCDYVDGGTSGATLDRPALAHLFDHIVSADVDYVITTNMLRLACRRADLTFLIAALGGYGTDIALAGPNTILSLDGEHRPPGPAP